MKVNKSDIKPKVTIVLDCVPTNIEERKNNIKQWKRNSYSCV